MPSDFMNMIDLLDREDKMRQEFNEHSWRFQEGSRRDRGLYPSNHPIDEIRVSEFPSQNFVVDVLRGATYKPNWTFGIHQPIPDIIGALSISIQTTESISGGYSIFTHTRPIPPYIGSRGDAEYWVMEQIIKVETHEAMEFFKVNGRAPFFPHTNEFDTQYSLRPSDGRG